MIIKPNDDKHIDLLVADFKMQAETGPFVALGGFFAMDSSVESPKAVFEVKLTEEEI